MKYYTAFTLSLWFYKFYIQILDINALILIYGLILNKQTFPFTFYRSYDAFINSWSAICRFGSHTPLVFLYMLFNL